MGDDSKSDNTLILDRINRLETRIDNNISRLEEKNDSNYTRLEEKLDSNNTRLEEKLNEWISKFDNSFETLKDKVNDHEYRIKNIENSRKDQNDKIFNMLAKATDSGSFTIPNKKEEASAWKKIVNHPAIPAITFSVLILAFISGNFDGLLKIISLFVSK